MAIAFISIKHFQTIVRAWTKPFFPDFILTHTQLNLTSRHLLLEVETHPCSPAVASKRERGFPWSETFTYFRNTNKNTNA